MKPFLQKLPLPSDSSFVLVDFDKPYYETPWHFHPEYEIVLVTESSGQRFIGEHIKEYRTGDLCLIGPNVPHLYRSHEEYYAPDSELRAKSIVIHFNDNFLGKDFFKIPEMSHIQALFEKSNRVLDITGDSNQFISSKLYEMFSENPTKRLLSLLEILSDLDPVMIVFVPNKIYLLNSCEFVLQTIKHNAKITIGATTFFIALL